jgi:hypothetical protein
VQGGDDPCHYSTKRTHPEYGLVVALICMAPALLVAKHWRQQSSAEFSSAVVSGVEEGNEANYFVCRCCRCRRRNSGLVVEKRQDHAQS